MNDLYLDYVDPDILGGFRHWTSQAAVMQCLETAMHHLLRHVNDSLNGELFYEASDPIIMHG